MIKFLLPFTKISYFLFISTKLRGFKIKTYRFINYYCFVYITSTTPTTIVMYTYFFLFIINKRFYFIYI